MFFSLMENYAKIEEEKEEERKRKRSGAASILGLWGSVTSRMSERAHLPFPREKGQDDSDSECDVKVSYECDVRVSFKMTS